jgi:hypothetical protein
MIQPVVVVGRPPDAFDVGSVGGYVDGGEDFVSSDGIMCLLFQYWG